MAVAIEPSEPPVAASLGDSTWKTSALVAGLSVLVLWRATSLIDREWLALFPRWLLLIVLGAIPQLFLLIFPFATRQQRGRHRIGLPTFSSIANEAAVALAIVGACLFAIAAAQYALQQFSPETTFVRDFLQRWTDSRGDVQLYLMLFAILYAPIAEEVFYRGFLFNAFRRRMPGVVAAILESIIFGFAHFSGTTHAVVAVLIGLVLTAVYIWRKSLLASVFVHAGLNFAIAVGVLFSMSGHQRVRLVDLPERGHVVAGASGGLQFGKDTLQDFERRGHIRSQSHGQAFNADLAGTLGERPISEVGRGRFGGGLESVGKF